MEKTLNQEQIDAMVRTARSGGHNQAVLPPQPPVEPWDVRQAGQIGPEQLRAITLLHEGFAKNLAHSLGAYLRVVFGVTLISAEHLTYREFLQCFPETTYLASCRLDPMGINAALQLDLKIAFPIIDLLLGGEGKGIEAARAVTEIEVQILDSVARIVCRELGATWQALALEVVFDERLDAAAARRLMLPGEKTLSVNFEITMPDVCGGLNLAVPTTVSNALLRKISADWSPHRPHGAADSRQRLMPRLLDCPFTVELGATEMRVAMSALAALAPGRLLSFARSAEEPASLLIAGREKFHALPVCCGHTRAARVLESVRKAAGGLAETKEKSK